MEEEVGGMLSPSGSSPSGLAIRRKNPQVQVFFSVVLKQKHQTIDIKCVIYCKTRKTNQIQPVNTEVFILRPSPRRPDA